MRRFRYEYGSGPLHLLGLAASFAITGYAVLQLLPGAPLNLLIWFLGAVVAHDLLLLPLYSLLDRLLARAAGAGERPPPPVSALNHLRAPALLSGLLLLVWFPLILALPGRRFAAATGRALEGYMGSWLTLSGLLFGGSALLYLVRRTRARAADG